MAVQRIDIGKIGGNSDQLADANEIKLVEAKVGKDEPFEIKIGKKWVSFPNIAAFKTAVTAAGNDLEKLAANYDTQASSGEAAPLEGELAKALEKAAEALNEATTKEAKDLAKGELTKLLAQAQRQGVKSEALDKYGKLLNGNLKGAKATSTTSPSTGGSGSSGGTGSASGAKAQQAPTTAFPPSGWGAQTSGAAAFSSDAYMQSLQTTDSVLSSWDEVNKNQNKGKQLMMLFFYFAKMAESGDMGAMYQFMKFITYIVSKDKAKQQIEMGKKLIELQDLSRQWTNKLTSLSTSSTDASASNELMKTMTIVKSETDAIATSQKLISQMMEEFAQVVETLTNTTKSALETAGRIQRTVSRFSA